MAGPDAPADPGGAGIKSREEEAIATRSQGSQQVREPARPARPGSPLRHLEVARHQPAHAAVLQLQRAAGNRATAALLATRANSRGTVRSGAGTVRARRELPGPAPARQQLAGNRAAAGPVVLPVLQPALVAQRQSSLAAARTSFRLDGQLVATSADLSGWYHTRLGRLRTEAVRMVSDGVLVPPHVFAVVSSAGPELVRLRSLGAAELDDDTLGRAVDWLISYEDAFTLLDRAYARAAAANIERSVAGLEGAGRGIDQATAQLHDQQRRALIAGDENAMLATTDLLQSVLDTALAFKDGVLELRRTSTQLLAEELKWLGKGTPPSARWLPAVVDIATRIDKAYAAFSVARAAYTVAMGGISEGEEARQGVSAMTTILSAGATLLNASASLTVYINVYVAPMAGMALKLLAKLEDQSREWNLERMQEGNWDLVNWWVEPTSSRSMFIYLRHVMAASDSGSIPTPPGPVADVFLKRRGVLAAGAGQEVPTTGVWFWRRLDESRTKRWLFAHRREVWAMFFGSAPPPR